MTHGLMRLSVDGAVLDPRAAGIILAWIQAVEFYGLGDLVPYVQQRVFTAGGALVRVGDRWCLTPWGELTLRELIGLALRVGVPAPLKREQMLGAVALAGYDRPAARTE